MADIVPFTPEGINQVVSRIDLGFLQNRGSVPLEFSGMFYFWVCNSFQTYSDAYLYFYGDDDWKLESRLMVDFDFSVLASVSGAHSSPSSAGFRTSKYFELRTSSNQIITTFYDETLENVRNQIKDRLFTFWKLNELNRLCYQDPSFIEKLSSELVESGHLKQYAKFIKEYPLNEYAAIGLDYVQQITTNLGGNVEDFYLLKKKG